MLTIILGISAAIFIATIAIIMYESRKSALNNAIDISAYKSEELASQISKFFENSVVTLQNLKDHSLALRSIDDKNRNHYQEITKQTLQTTAASLSIWALWEPNELDGNDNAYRNIRPYNKLGHMNASYFRNGSRIEAEIGELEDLDKEYYQIPFNSKKIEIMPPYYYSYKEDGSDQFFETTIAIPIIENGKSVGVVGSDIDLKGLSEMMSKVKIYQTGYAILISDKGVIAADANKKNLSKNISECYGFINQNITSSINKGNATHEMMNASKETVAQLISTTPVVVEGCDTKWSVCVVVPKKEILADANKLLIRGLIISIIGLIILSIVIYTQSRSIVQPILSAVSLSKEIATGNLRNKINITRNDELGELQESLKSMNEKLVDIVSDIQSAVGNLVDGSSNINEVSQSLSSAANELASSSEEVTSTMEEIASSIEQNSQNTNETEKIANVLMDNAEKVRNASNESITSINNIANKVGLINDIAFQTNILALNAAVEAARAGEHGRGFAVVANEVNRLANNSKTASDEINDIAQTSVKTTAEASGLLENIIPQIQKTSMLIKEIASASREQDAGAEQVNMAIQQLNDVAQQNASISEELSASAESINDQAEQLRNLISYFKS